MVMQRRLWRTGLAEQGGDSGIDMFSVCDARYRGVIAASINSFLRHSA